MNNNSYLIIFHLPQHRARITNQPEEYLSKVDKYAEKDIDDSVSLRWVWRPDYHQSYRQIYRVQSVR